MLILLPPSEGKAPPARRGDPVDLAALALPELGPVRRELLQALVTVSDREDAASILGLGRTQLADLDLNRRLPELPARPAADIYTGVLYAALDLASLPPAARRRARAAVLVQSALWGPIRLTDRIPPYRLSIGTRLPGVEPLAGLWQRALGGVLQTRPGKVVVDCRSSGYAAAWRPPEPESTVRITAQSVKDGRRAVVSHFAKQTRGLVVRMLLEAPRQPRTPQQVAAVVGRQARCELTGPDRAGWQLTVLSDATGRPCPA